MVEAREVMELMQVGCRYKGRNINGISKIGGQEELMVTGETRVVNRVFLDCKALIAVDVIKPVKEWSESVNLRSIDLSDIEKIPSSESYWLAGGPDRK